MRRLMGWDRDTRIFPRRAALRVGLPQLPWMPILMPEWAAAFCRAAEESHMSIRQIADRRIFDPASNSYREAPGRCLVAENKYRTPESERLFPPEIAPLHPKRW